MFENIENLNKTASMAVSAFGVEGKAVFVQISENATYFICQNNKPIYTLRICRPNYHTFEELESEIQWLLNIDDVNICKPISKNGIYKSTLPTEEVSHLSKNFFDVSLIFLNLTYGGFPNTLMVSPI